jgi:hypothetical protein
MKVEGRCHCGAIRYQADVDPATAAICHCTDCQMLGGSAFRANVQASSASFVLRSGTPKTYVKTTAESGASRVHAFCGDCGSPVYSCALDDPPTYSLRLGCLQPRDALVPKKRIWTRSAMAWSTNVGAIEGRERQ